VDSIRQLVRRLEEDKEALVVLAAQPGSWSAPALKDLVGAWVERGTAVGELVDGSQFHFSAIVSQNEASRLFSDEIRGAGVKLAGQADITLSVGERMVIPADRRRLPSPALGWLGGGEVPVSASDSTGVEAAEPFFEVRANVTGSPSAELLHGRGGRIRFELRPAPLLEQWMRRFRQMVQRRYGL
jgi:putative peptide zinc metalloprotease protein